MNQQSIAKIRFKLITNSITYEAYKYIENTMKDKLVARIPTAAKML